MFFYVEQSILAQLHQALFQLFMPIPFWRFMKFDIKLRAAVWLLSAAAAALLSACATPVVMSSIDNAQPVTTTTVNLGTPVAIAAKLRAPTSGVSHVGIVVMHPYGTSVDGPPCTKLAQRGFTALCIDSMYTNKAMDYYGYEQHVPAIREAINYLRSQPGIKKVLLFGHSMSAPMMTFYQNVAQNGPSVCTGPEKLMPCVTTNLNGLPVADGLILFDAHLGESLATYTYIDPAVPNNTFGPRIQALDMFSPANGYNATTSGGTYSETFKTSFLAAQAARNDALTNQALLLLAQHRAVPGNGASMGDDIPFTVVGATSARLWQADLSLMQCTQKPQILLSYDGTRPTKVVCSVRPPSGAAKTGLAPTATLKTNVHIWLGAHAMRTSGVYTQTLNDIRGVDYSSTATSTVGNITTLTQPLLMIANGGHYFLRSDEIVFDTARMTDKTFAILEGATHGGTECTACEAQLGLPQPASATSFGYYGDTLSRSMDFIAEWINKRY